MSDKIKFVIACKKSPEYDVDYIYHISDNLYSMLEEEHELVVYTDIDIESDDFTTVKFENDFPGWWCKLECFRTVGKCIYLDLDTTIFSNLKTLIKAMDNLDQYKFGMLSDLYKNPQHPYASGVMCWNGDFSWIYDFVKNKETNLESVFYRSKNVLNWDQSYISKLLLKYKIDIVLIQNICAIGSYKKDIIFRNHLPQDFDIVCFHGVPKPKMVGSPYWYS